MEEFSKVSAGDSEVGHLLSDGRSVPRSGKPWLSTKNFSPLNAVMGADSDGLMRPGPDCLRSVRRKNERPE